MSSFLPSVRRRLDALSDYKLRVIYAVAAIATLGVTIVFGALLFKESVSNSDECLWQVHKSGSEFHVIVTEIVPGGSADNAGVRVGDRVVAINGAGIPNVMRADRYAQELLNQAPVDTPISYVVERNDEIVDLPISLIRNFKFYHLIYPALSVLWVLIGSMVVLTQPRGRVQQIFFFTAITTVFALTIPPVVGLSPALYRLILSLWSTIGVCFYISWVYFCTVFPVDQKIFRTTGRKAMLVVPMLVLLVLSVAPRVLMLFDIYLGESAYMSMQIISGVIGTAYFTTGVLFLFLGYRKLPHSADRRPMTVILAGTILAGLAMLYFGLLQTTTNINATAVLYPQYLLPMLLLLALPVSFGYAIFKYQVMDFRLVLMPTLVYTATMGLIAGLYLGIAYGLGQAMGVIFGEMFEAVEIFIFVLFMMLFEPVKRRVQTTIENRFFPQRRDYSSHLATYSAEISETVGSVAVAELTAQTLKDALDLYGVYVAVENNEAVLQLIAKATDLQPIEIDQAALDALSRLLHNSHTIISLETVREPMLADLQRWFSYAVGLYAQGRVIGAVVMTRPKDNESLSGSQIPFIAGITAQGASAIEVARLYEEELKRQRYLEELNTARRIQQSLLPARMPDIAGISISAVSTPASSVGGDYYDVISLSDDQFLVIIADVSGKGLPASLYMAEFHGMVHIASSMSSRPQEILKTLNKHLHEIIAASAFITATLLLFDTARRTVSFARAGHTPMIRRNGATVDTLTPSGIALGLAPQELFATSLNEYTVEYEPGETFILYSDGVSEAMNSRHEEFGDGRLLDVISASTSSGADALCDRILSNVELFRGGAEQNDDITLVVIEIEKQASDARAVVPSVRVGQRV